MPTESQLVSTLNQNGTIKDVFISICENNAEKQIIGNGYRWVIKSITIEEIINQILTKYPNEISREMIELSVNYFITEKLLKHVESKEIKNVVDSAVQEDQIHVQSDTDALYENKKVQLTNRNDFVLCSGIQLYEAFLDIEENQKRRAALETSLEGFFNSLQQPLDEKIDELSKEVANSKKFVEKITRESLIKNIEIISLFTAVITLLLTNVIGFVGSSPVDIKKIIALNFSVIFSLIILLIVINSMLIDRKLDKKTFILLIIALVELATVVVVFTVR